MGLLNVFKIKDLFVEVRPHDYGRTSTSIVLQEINYDIFLSQKTKTSFSRTSDPFGKGMALPHASRHQSLTSMRHAKQIRQILKELLTWCRSLFTGLRH
jgi:hypothetical protein